MDTEEDRKFNNLPSVTDSHITIIPHRDSNPKLPKFNFSKSYLTLIPLVVIMVGVAISTYFIKLNQDIRSRASQTKDFALIKLMRDPATGEVRAVSSEVVEGYDPLALGALNSSTTESSPSSTPASETMPASKEAPTTTPVSTDSVTPVEVAPKASPSQNQLQPVVKGANDATFEVEQVGKNGVAQIAKVKFESVPHNHGMIYAPGPDIVKDGIVPLEEIAYVRFPFDTNASFSVRSTATGQKNNLQVPRMEKAGGIQSSLLKKLPFVKDAHATGPTRKVMVITFNPLISEDGPPTRLNQLMGWSNPTSLENQYISLLSGIKNTTFTVVNRIEVDDIPAKVDGYKYTDLTYMDCLRDNTRCHSQDLAYYDPLLSQYHVCDKANNGEIDELWIWGGPHFGFFEANMAGPGGFNTAGWPVGSTCTKQLNIMGFSYQRGVSEMLENMAHRIEGTTTHYKGGWNYNYGQVPSSRPANLSSWDYFTARGFDIGINAGCGNAHGNLNTQVVNLSFVPEFTTTTNELSTCSDFPNLGSPQNINCTTWNCDFFNFKKMWIQRVPNEWWGRALDFNNPPVTGGETIIGSNSPPPPGGNPPPPGGNPPPPPASHGCGCGASCGTGATCAYNTGLGCDSGLSCAPNSAGNVCYSASICGGGNSCPTDRNTQFWWGCPGEPYVGCNGLSGWRSGLDLNVAKPSIPFDLDVNCFASLGQAFSDARIELVGPTGAVVASSNTFSLRNYIVTQPGNYTARCIHKSNISCKDEDSFTVTAPQTAIAAFDQTQADAASSNKPKLTVLSANGATLYYKFYTNGAWENSWGTVSVSGLSGLGQTTIRSFNQAKAPDGKERQTVVSTDGTKHWVRFWNSTTGWPAWSNPQAISTMNLPGGATKIAYYTMTNGDTETGNKPKLTVVSANGSYLYYKFNINGVWDTNWGTVTVANMGLGVSQIRSFNQTLAPNGKPKQTVVSVDGKTTWLRYWSTSWGAWETHPSTEQGIPGATTTLLPMP